MIELSERTGTEYKIIVANNGYILEAHGLRNVYQSFSELASQIAWMCLFICNEHERDQFENRVREFILKSEKK